MVTIIVPCTVLIFIVSVVVLVLAVSTMSAVPFFVLVRVFVNVYSVFPAMSYIRVIAPSRSILRAFPSYRVTYIARTLSARRKGKYKRSQGYY